MEKIDRATHVLKIDGDRGEVRIADEVVAIIAGMAATDVRGVASMAGNIKKFEANILKVSGIVQDKVKAAIENMTGMKVSEVNVRVAGIVLE